STPITASTGGLGGERGNCGAVAGVVVGARCAHEPSQEPSQEPRKTTAQKRCMATAPFGSHHRTPSGPFNAIEKRIVSLALDERAPNHIVSALDRTAMQLFVYIVSPKSLDQDKPWAIRSRELRGRNGGNRRAPFM